MREQERKEMRRAAETGAPVSPETALAVLRCGGDEIPEVLACSTLVRKRFFGNRFRLCAILNAKSGECSEDCAFCAQSAHHQTGAGVFGILSAEEMLAAYDAHLDLPVSHFGIVTSGRALSGGDIDRVCETVASRPGGPIPGALPLAAWTSPGCCA